MSKSEDAVAGWPGQRKICRWCVHYRMRPEVVLFSTTELAAPGVLKARNEWDQQRTQRAFQEKERVLSRQPFDYEPHYYPWCAFHTTEAGGVSINPVTGETSPLYILCVWKNEHEDCGNFTARDHV
jgi:hypothetical protein